MPTTEQADQAAKEADFGSAGQQAQAQGERVVRGATLGAVPGFGSPEDIRARADVSQKLSPVTSFAADTLPAVGAAALAATGVGALAEGLGAAAGGAVAGTAALAGESAAGGLVGAGQAAYERGQYLGEDPGRDAENALIMGGINFGLGAAAHALFGGAGKAAAKASALSEEGAVEGAARESVEDVAKTAEADALSRAPARQEIPVGANDTESLGADLAPAAEELSPEAAKAARVAELSRGFNDATGLPTEGAPAVEPRVPGAEVAVQRQAERAAVDDGMDRALSKASRAEADDIVEQAVGEKLPAPEADSFGRQRRLYQNRDAILDVASREMQSDLGQVMADVPAFVSGEKRASTAAVSDNLASQRLVTDGIAKSAAELAGTLRGEARAYAAATGSKGLQYQVPGSKRLVQDLMFHAQALSEADTGKAMFEAARGFEQVLRDSRAELPQLGTLTAQVRTALEDPAVWGKAGDAQKAFNAVVHDQLAPALDTLGAGWDSRVKGLLKGDDVGRAQQVTAALDALDQLASVRSQFGDAAGSRMADQIAKIRRTMGLAEEVQDASGRMQALGGVVGHVPLVGGLAKEWVTGDLANAFRRLSGAVDRGIDRGVDDWIASSRVRGDSGSLLGSVALKTARAVTGTGEDSAIAQIARRQSISLGLARFMGSDQNPQAAFERARAAIQSDEQFFQAMGQDYKSLQQQAPETYLMLAGRAAQARQFLLQRMPANVSVSMMRPAGYPPSRDAIEDWSVYWNAIKDPMHVVSNVRSARVQEIQTLQAVYPRLYERLQQRVIEKIGAAQTAGVPLGDSLLMRLNLLFNLDGAGSPAFSRQVGQMARDYNAAQQQAPGQSGSSQAAAPSPALMPGPVQGIAQSGATFGSGF